MNPLLPGGFGTTPEPTRNASGINQGTNQDDSQNDPHPEAGLFHGQREQNSGTERGYDTTSAEKCGKNGKASAACKTTSVAS